MSVGSEVWAVPYEGRLAKAPTTNVAAVFGAHEVGVRKFNAEFALKRGVASNCYDEGEEGIAAAYSNPRRDRRRARFPGDPEKRPVGNRECSRMSL